MAPLRKGSTINSKLIFFAAFSHFIIHAPFAETRPEVFFSDSLSSAQHSVNRERRSISADSFQNGIPNLFYSGGIMNQEFISSISGRTFASIGGKLHVCTTWGSSSYRTFDNLLYSFEGTCAYTLMHDFKADGFRISIVNNPDCFPNYKSGGCIRQVVIAPEVGSDYVIKYDDNSTVPQVYKGSRRLEVPGSDGLLVFSRVTHWLVVTSTQGYILKFDGIQTVTIHIDSKWKDAVRGLCGTLDGDPSNDLLSPDGSSYSLTDIEQFANSWANKNLVPTGQSCLNTGAPTNFSVSSSDAKRENAHVSCEKILGNDCRPSVSQYQWYYNWCKNEYLGCTSGSSCNCDTLAEYHRECFRNGRTPFDWGGVQSCSKHTTCSDDKAYNECGSLCLKTCTNRLQTTCPGDHCVEGCLCPPGNVLNSENICIPIETCPCEYQDAVYDAGKTIKMGCEQCKCVSGFWECYSNKCGARCSQISDVHYRTFDGKNYDFTGECFYTMVQNNDVTIAMEKSGCSSTYSHNVLATDPLTGKTYCLKKIYISLNQADNTKDTILMLPDKEVLVNKNLVMVLPYRYKNIIIDQDFTNIEVYITNLKIRILWDGGSHMYIDVPDALKENTVGMCGTYTNNQDDDFKTSSGDLEVDAYNFANKWRLPPSNGQCGIVTKIDAHPCTINTEMKMEDAMKDCKKLNEMDVFKACHSAVNPTPFVEACTYDLCSCRTSKDECMCSIFSSYVTACNRENIIIDWRTEVTVCGVHCSGDQTWTACANPCQDTCMTIAGFTECGARCYEGCACPKEETLNANGRCVPITKCPCIHENKEYESGYKQLRGMNYCECKEAKWDCHIATNAELNGLVANEMCPAADNKEDTDCRPKCPKTCANKDSAEPTCVESAGIQSDMCIAGCQCKVGYIYDESSKRCMLPFQCPCFHGGQRYNPGDSIQQDCKDCVCDAGKWKCEEKECPAECSAWGLEHYSTFDGKEFDFIGDCAYTLAKGSLDSYQMFEITIQNYPCSTTGMTCTKYISIKTGGGEVVFRQNDPIPQTLQYGVPLVVRNIGLYVYVKTDIGLSVLWDKGSRIYIRLMPKWKKTTVKGLCGNYDGDQSNDFTGPMGGFALPLASQFADEWKSFPYCPNAKEYESACIKRPHRKEWALRSCGVLFSDTFLACHGEVDPSPYHSRCISDSCACDTGGDCGCLCNALAAYAQQCNRKGVPLKWRQQSLCPIQCRTCDMYTPCKSVYPPLTCQTKEAYPGLVFGCDDEPCVEGCDPPKCPPGQIYLDETSLKCIPDDTCPEVPCTMWEGKVIMEGDPIENYGSECEQCFCTQGNITCSGVPCTTTEMTTIFPTPSSTPRCPNDQEYNSCAFLCNQTCDSLLMDLINASRCGHKDDCIPGCEIKQCEPPKVWLNIDTCIDPKQCPCKMQNGTYVAPNKVVLEEECKKCQCTNNTYDCWMPSECITTTPAPVCMEPMGAKSGDIEDYQYSALTNEPGYPPSDGRLDNSNGGFVGKLGSPGPYSIIIDLLEPRNISGIQMQGFDGSYPKIFQVQAGDAVLSLTNLEFKGSFNVINNANNSEQVTEYRFDNIKLAKIVKVTIVSYHNKPAMRIELLGCFHPYPTTPPPPADPCPELTALMSSNCTFPCNVNQSCDGVKCVATKDCPCVQDNQKYPVGNLITKTDCDKCICQAGGKSDCTPHECDDCPTGKESNATDTCTCDCKCKDGYRLCPTDDICIPDPEWCDGIQTCTDDETGCPPPDECKYIGDNIDTFDSVNYDYSICNNVLMRDKINNLFSINIHRECNTTDTNKCTKYLIIKHVDDELKFNDDLSANFKGSTYEGKIQVEGLGNQNPGYELTYNENSDIIFKSNTFNFTATWSKEKSVKIEVKSDMYQKVDGLCGYYDGNKTADLMLPSSSSVTNETKMGDDWERKGSEALEECIKEECSAEKLVQATLTCTALIAEPFHLCTEKVNLRNYYQACVTIMCDCEAANKTTGECLCNALTPLAKDCQEARQGTPIPGWREKHNCIPECDRADMTWQECGPLCETTCKNYEGTPECATDCTPGCYCPTGLVLNEAGDKCIEPQECQDCECTGFGDPHIFTFDGMEYSANIDCEVHLAKHKTDAFDIIGYHGPCKEEPNMSCLNSIKIDQNEVTYSILIDENSLVIGTKNISNSELPYIDDYVWIEGMVGEVIVVYMDTKNLEVTFFPANHGFRIVFPSKIYYNTVAGTCGRCNHDISDEMWMSSGQIANDTNSFLSSWLIGSGTCDIKSKDVSQDAIDNLPNDVCSQFTSPAFIKCNPMVDPNPFIDTCKNDYIMANDKSKAMCKNLMAYARKCCYEGIALDNWDVSSSCAQECPDDLEYQVCRKPCQKTCENYKTFNPNNCPMSLVDGCFCPNQTALIDGKCQDPSICEFCDDEGHQVGDVWEKGPCMSCTCNCTSLIVCTKVECPLEITCSDSENKVEIPMTPAECCQKHRCVPKCADANIPVCELSQRLQTQLDQKNCSYYECVCDPVACSPLTMPFLEEGQQVITKQAGCCPALERMCNSSLCPEKLTCDPPFTYEDTSGECCPIMACVPPPATCEYTNLTGNITNYQFGDTWQDGPCINCSCKNESYNYITDCIKQECQPISSLPSAEEFELELVVDGTQCCPAVKRTSCKINNETINDGEKVSDVNNTCISYSCSKNDDGNLERTKLETQCNVNCLPFEKYVEPVAGICCGGCTPDKCIHNNVNRTINETWTDVNDKCLNHTCLLNDVMTEVYTEKKYECPEIDSNCPEEHRITDEEYEGCCLKCAVEPECTLIEVPLNETINLISTSDQTKNCTNKNAVKDLTFCRGTCGNHCIVSGDFNPHCLCCEVKKYEDVNINLECTDGTNSNTTVRKATECSCGGSPETSSPPDA